MHKVLYTFKVGSNYGTDVVCWDFPSYIEKGLNTVDAYRLYAFGKSWEVWG